MTDRPTLSEARAARDLAVQQVGDAAPASFTDAALTAVVQIAAAKHRFTADDVWTALLQQGVDTPPEPRAMGAVMQRAVREGLCHLATCPDHCGTKKVMVTGRSRASHAGDVPVYLAGPAPKPIEVSPDDLKMVALAAAGQAQQAYQAAQEGRVKAFKAARAAGATFADISGATGLARSNVHSLVK